MRTRVNVHAENGLLDLDGVAHLPNASPAPIMASGLVMVIWPRLYIRTGIAMGPVVVELEALDTTPEDQGDGQWEDVAELTAEHLADANVTVHGSTEIPPPGAVLDVPGAASLLRIRVSATGRALAYDLAVVKPVEHYLIQIWPTDTSDPHVISSSSTMLFATSSVQAVGQGTRAPDPPHQII